jgi:hypothetical protein
MCRVRDIINPINIVVGVLEGVPRRFLLIFGGTAFKKLECLCVGILKFSPNSNNIVVGVLEGVHRHFFVEHKKKHTFPAKFFSKVQYLARPTTGAKIKDGQKYTFRQPFGSAEKMFQIFLGRRGNPYYTHIDPPTF